MLTTDLIVAKENLPTEISDLTKFVLIGRDKLQAVRAEISALSKFELAKEVHAQKVLEGQKLGELVLMAETKLGELFNSTPKAKENQYTKNAISTCVETAQVEKGKPKMEVAKELGFSKDQVSDFQKLADNPAAVQKAISDAKDKGEIPTRSAVMKEIQENNRKAKADKQEVHRAENSAKIEKLKTPLDAQGLFQTIVIDPPWDWSDEGDFNQFGRAKPEYQTMPLEEIKNLPVGKIADDNCHLYLWVTNRSLPKAFDLVQAWGFRYITCLTWIKPSIGMGNYFRGNTEQVIFAVKGSQPLKRHDVGTSFLAPRGKSHSEKPEEFYKMVESCSYAPLIDIFGRREREGWTVWGENG